MFRPHFALLAFGLAAASAWAQPAQNGPSLAPPPTVFSRVSDIFGGDLPQLDLPDTVKLIFRPHFGDFVRRDYMRVDTGLRWALNEHFDLSAEADVYFTHGLGGSSSDGYGIGKLRAGVKYVFERWPKADYETSVALNIDRPVGHPPLDMTDGHNHLTPTFIVQHHSYKRPHLTTFAGMGFDLISKSNALGIFSTNQPHDNSVFVTAGGVYDVGQIKWTLTSTYTTTSLVSNHPHQFFYIQPGLLWYVPRKYTFHSKTQWIVGLGAGTSFGPDGTHFSLSSRVRAEITFRQVMEKIHLAKPK